MVVFKVRMQWAVSLMLVFLFITSPLVAFAEPPGSVAYQRFFVGDRTREDRPTDNTRQNDTGKIVGITVLSSLVLIGVTSYLWHRHKKKKKQESYMNDEELLKYVEDTTGPNANKEDEAQYQKFEPQTAY